MRKFYKLGTVVALAAVLGLTGCGEEDSKPTQTTSAQPTTQVTTQTTTQSTTKATQAATVKPTQSTTKATQAATTKPTQVATTSKFGSKADILAASTTKALCETDLDSCRVYVQSADHPYDVVYYYGKEYQTYVDACDWSLVFDAKYYKEQFPMLALLYHNNDAMLLEHFQTVGVHEGRQGSANFNVGAYRLNSGLKPEFGRNWAAYYIYYMMNYSSQKKVNTLKANDGTAVYRQYSIVYTKMQSLELSRINQYRGEVNVANVKFDSELAAFANYHAYLNAHDGYRAHGWVEQNTDANNAYLGKIAKWTSYGENNYENHSTNALTSINFAQKYKDSPKHYECMVNSKYQYTGTSNFYSNTGYSTQFDLYVAGTLTTAMHGEE